MSRGHSKIKKFFYLILLCWNLRFEIPHDDRRLDFWGQTSNRNHFTGVKINVQHISIKIRDSLEQGFTSSSDRHTCSRNSNDTSIFVALNFEEPLFSGVTELGDPFLQFLDSGFQIGWHCEIYLRRRCVAQWDCILLDLKVENFRKW